MSTPSVNLSPPILFGVSELHANPDLVAKIMNLGNEATDRNKIAEPEKWEASTTKRFESREYFFEQLGEDVLWAVIFDRASGENASNGTGNGAGSKERGLWNNRDRVVAIAAATPWHQPLGTWEMIEHGEVEEGWEFKAVCVDSDPKYIKTGLATNCMQALERALVEKEVKKLEATGVPGKEKVKVRLWIIAVECMNGVYWRKKGWKEIRRAVQGNGMWGCRTSFELVVLTKDSEVLE
ncbi:hypothetical protein BDV96DRAFT_567978 [Lophiotrema nucula]|uniref:N-acetyltransferase domain-containing protein n=1 Tax=Lophiotrema nucula TaxID=690887 RepID=A0A6A5ZKV3_9PLEO|nr:hypothetical protein BDV96DRAFT_567978 [Lophiotrema nucula]